MKKCIQFCRQLSASGILAILFLIYIFYVGAAKLPDFIEKTLNFPTSGISLREYIRSTNEMYEDMLENQKDTPALKSKGTYINFNGLMARLLGQTELNNRVKLRNGNLAWIEDQIPPEKEIAAVAENIARISKRQQQKGKHMLFVIAPSQMAKYEDLLPPGYSDTSNDVTDMLLQQLGQLGVPCLDLRENLREDGIINAEAFFATDHHWKPETGFWAYGEILEALENMGAIGPVDTFYTDAENYDFKLYKDCFLGSSGWRTGKYFAGVDDFCLISPKFDTNISVEIASEELYYEGPYELSVNYPMPESYYLEPDYFNRSMYDVYGRNNTPPILRLNADAPQDGRFMLIGDSYGNVPFSFFSIYIKNSYEFDMRMFDGNFEQVYETYDPDTVVFLINANSSIQENSTYQFFSE